MIAIVKCDAAPRSAGAGLFPLVIKCFKGKETLLSAK